MPNSQRHAMIQYLASTQTQNLETTIQWTHIMQIRDRKHPSISP